MNNLENNIFEPKTLENYEKLYKESIDESTMEDFWKTQVDAIDWDTKPTKILDKSKAPFYKWFPDGKLNFCYNTLDRHIKNGFGDNRALIWESAYSKNSVTYTYNQLYKEVNKFSKILLDNGIQKGDRVLIYMPMICQSIIYTMACWRIGAIHSIVFGGFASLELSDRINNAQPKVIICASCGIEPRKKINYFSLVNQALIHSKNTGRFPDCDRTKILLFQREDALVIEEKEIKECQFETIIINKEMEKLSDDVFIKPLDLKSTDFLYILYTSGTTGIPKGIIRDIGGTAVTAFFTMKYILNLNRGDIIFSSSDIGWVVGHLFIIYGPLIVGATSIIFEGKPIGTPNCGKCFEIIQKYKAKIFYTAPTVVRAYKKEDPDCKIIHSYDVSSLETVCLSGERCDAESFSFMQKCVGEDKVINDHWWQTESGYPICCNNINIHKFPNIPGETGRPMLGFNVKITEMDHKRNIIKEINETNKSGIICIKLPTPPSFMFSLFGNNLAYENRYLTPDKKYYITEDIGEWNKDGSISILSRNDDMIKIAGHRLTTGRMEESIILGVKEIAEVAVVPVKDNLKGETPFAFCVVKDFVKKEDYPKIIDIVKNNIAFSIGAISRLKGAIICERLPKTRSGKIIRKLLKNIINEEEYEIPPTIEDRDIVPLIIKNLKEMKFIK